jgi:hypothetical protein
MISSIWAVGLANVTGNSATLTIAATGSEETQRSRCLLCDTGQLLSYG